MRITLRDENCQEMVESQKFVPDPCQFCNGTPIVYLGVELHGIRPGQVRCSCGAAGQKVEFDWKISSDDAMVHLVSEWNRVHGETFLDQLKESLTYG